jgi:hypothetical protein
MNIFEWIGEQDIFYVIGLFILVLIILAIVYSLHGNIDVGFQIGCETIGKCPECNLSC